MRVSGISAEFDKLHTVIQTNCDSSRKQEAVNDGFNNRVDKGTQLMLAQSYRNLAAQQQSLSLKEVEFRNFSQTGEDGILLYLFALLGTTNCSGQVKLATGL